MSTTTDRTEPRQPRAKERVTRTINVDDASGPVLDESTAAELASARSPETARAQAELAATSQNSFQHKLIMSLAVVLPFAGFVTAIVFAWTVGWMNWFFFGMLVVGWLLTGTGITVGFHRLFSHRSFETYPIVRAYWILMGSFAVQGSPLTWCSVHRKHHERSDLEGDPHSPHLHDEGWWNSIKGFAHSHTGWLFSHHWSEPTTARYVPDLLRDPMLVRIDRQYYLCVLASLIIPTAIGGIVTASWLGALLGFLWGGLARVFVVHHITWSINSICHIFGRRDYESDDHSRNNLLCGLLGQGEGWHNNHHAFPSSARHGLKWWQFDLSWYIIRSMQLVGLAWNVRLPGEKALAAKRIS